MNLDGRHRDHEESRLVIELGPLASAADLSQADKDRIRDAVERLVDRGVFDTQDKSTNAEPGTPGGPEAGE